MAAGSNSVLLDTSAVVAILTREAGMPRLVERLLCADLRLLPTPCAAESLMVLRTRFATDPLPIFEEFLREFDIQLIPFEAHHLTWFNHGFSSFGKGRHPAALNMGDCFTYAISKSSGSPVLFTGSDFSRTDLDLAC